MTSEGSVTTWIGQLKAGDPDAAQKLWERYFGRLVQMARRKLRVQARRAADEEDVVLSVFASLWEGAGQGDFPLLQDRDDLWRLLVVLTARKAINLRRHETRQKRGGGAVLDEAALANAAARDGELGLEQVLGAEPTPEFAAEVAEECRRLLDLLEDEDLRRVALWKMEGYTVAEIAPKLGCMPRTVQRKLRTIRQLWDGEGRA